MSQRAGLALKVAERVQRCATCHQRLHDERDPVLDCPRCGVTVHLSCVWEEPSCARCGESLQNEVARHAYADGPSTLRVRWETFKALLRALRTHPLVILAQCHSNRGRWMGIPVALFIFGVIAGILLTILGLWLAKRG